MTRPVKIAFIWEQFGPYHIDRCRAVATGSTWSVVGIEIAEISAAHLWDRPAAPTDFRLVTLCAGLAGTHSKAKVFFRLLKQIWKEKPKFVFTCHYERPEIFLACALLRVMGIPVVV